MANKVFQIHNTVNENAITQPKTLISDSGCSAYFTSGTHQIDGSNYKIANTTLTLENIFYTSGTSSWSFPNYVNGNLKLIKDCYVEDKNNKGRIVATYSPSIGYKMGIGIGPQQARGIFDHRKSGAADVNSENWIIDRHEEGWTYFGGNGLKYGDVRNDILIGSNGRRRLYKNGFMEIWYWTDINTTINTATGPVYFSANQTVTFNPDSLGIPFSSIPYVQVTATTAGSGYPVFWVSKMAGIKEVIGNLACGNARTSSTSFRVCVYAFGLADTAALASLED